MNSSLYFPVFKYYLCCFDAQIYRWPQGRPFSRDPESKMHLISRWVSWTAYTQDFSTDFITFSSNLLLLCMSHLCEGHQNHHRPSHLPPSSTSLSHQTPVNSTSYIYLDSPTYLHFHRPGPSHHHFSLICCNEALLTHSLSCFLSVYFNLNSNNTNPEDAILF